MAALPRPNKLRPQGRRSLFIISTGAFGGFRQGAAVLIRGTAASGDEHHDQRCKSNTGHPLPTTWVPHARRLIGHMAEAIELVRGRGGLVSRHTCNGSLATWRTASSRPLRALSSLICPMFSTMSVRLVWGAGSFRVTPRCCYATSPNVFATLEQPLSGVSIGLKSDPGDAPAATPALAKELAVDFASRLSTSAGLRLTAVLLAPVLAHDQLNLIGNEGGTASDKSTSTLDH